MFAIFLVFPVIGGWQRAVYNKLRIATTSGKARAAHLSGTIEEALVRHLAVGTSLHALQACLHEVSWQTEESGEETGNSYI